MNHHINIALCPLPHAAGLDLPKMETLGAAGFDLAAALDVGQVMTLKPLQRVLVPTGLSIALPLGWEAQIRPRSGLAFKNGITVLNSPGTIDSNYRGEIKVLLVNLSQDDFSIERGMRIAQMVVARHAFVTFDVMQSLDETHRGHGGFGSTGL